MVFDGQNSIATEEGEITKILISIICLYGNNGLPFGKVNEEFKNYCGFDIPYKKFGAESLRSWILTLPDIYLVQDHQNNEVLIQQSRKSTHIRELILKQKLVRKNQRKYYNSYYNQRGSKRPRRFEPDNLPEESFIHTHSSINNIAINGSDRFEMFNQLECMLPLLYKHQALGDDFFLDVADTKLGYYVPENGPKECGLCTMGQTISSLTDKVKNAVYLAPRVVVMIGFQDLYQGRNVNNMIYDLRQLVIQLKKKNTRVTLITLIPSPKLPKLEKLEERMDIFNKAILDYACDNDLKCNVIDMYTIFTKEAEYFRKDFDRFIKVTKKDPYKVFSDYGRKIFLSALRSCLKEQIEAGH